MGKNNDKMAETILKIEDILRGIPEKEEIDWEIFRHSNYYSIYIYNKHEEKNNER